MSQEKKDIEKYSVIVESQKNTQTLKNLEKAKDIIKNIKNEGGEIDKR